MTMDILDFVLNEELRSTKTKDDRYYPRALLMLLNNTTWHGFHSSHFHRQPKRASKREGFLALWVKVSKGTLVSLGTAEYVRVLCDAVEDHSEIGRRCQDI